MIRFLQYNFYLLFLFCFLACSDYDINESPPQSCISTNPVFFDEFTNPSWETEEGVTDWHQASWLQNGTQMAPSRVNTLYGKLELTVLPGEPFSGGSVQTRNDAWSYGLWEASLKPSPVPGVLNSMFTMDWNGGSHEEVDIEFLTHTFTSNNGYIHLAVHRAGESNVYVRDIELGFNPSMEFHSYGIQLMPDSVSWLVDGEIISTFEYTSEFSLQAPYQFFFNAWTKEDWINGPPTDTAVYQIEWVRFFPDTCSGIY